MRKVALLIGVSEYEPGLDGLPAAVRDVVAMQQVLANPAMGEFAEADITLLQNPDRQTMEDGIYTLFAHRQKDDLVLLYFSGHGLLDDGGEFYFASRSTRKDQGRLVPPTAVAARSVRDWMEQSRSQRKVIILDSCFSGAFAKGVKAKDSGSVNPEQFLGGKGTAILTASTSTQYALTQDGLDLSVYTHYLVEGIRTGGADQDDDGWIDMEELHAYASSKVKEAAPAMTPEFYPVKDGYKILLAKSPKDDPQLKYRKAVKQRAHQGRFSIPARRMLNSLRLQLGLAPEIAEAIEAEVLQPYRDYQRKLQEYEETLVEALQAENPLSLRTWKDLKDYEQHLALRDEDVAAINRKHLGAQKSDFLAEDADQSSVVEEVAAQKSDFLGKDAAQKSDFLGKDAAQPPSLAAEVGLLALDYFTFETVTVNNQGKVQNRKQNRAQYIAEDLGNGVTLEIVAIPGGEFFMGTARADRERIIRERTRHGASQNTAVTLTDREMPQHRVKLPDFWMGKVPITQAQWQAVASLPKISRELTLEPSHFKGDNRPMEQVLWHDAIEFCDRLSRKTGHHYRLPSEAEWEYACRAGTTTPFHFGETITTDLVNCDASYPYGDAPQGVYREQTTDVGSFPANPFGLYDMHGNVWEWCADHWHDNYQGAPTDGSAWIAGGSSERRSIRGGSWNDGPAFCRAAYRFYGSPADRYLIVGFRVVCAVFPGLF
jgi:formylglycine-generating enzyme required for sulfatase activity